MQTLTTGSIMIPNRRGVSIGLIVSSGLIVHLDAGNTSSYPGSGTTWSDISGNSRDFTITNGPTHNSGSAGYFEVDNTTDHYFSRTDANLLPGTGDFTMSAWILKTETIENAYIWDFGSNGGTISVGTTINSSWRYYNTTTGTGSDLYDMATPTATADVWYNVTMVRNSGTTTMYINNVSFASDSGDSFEYVATTLSLARYGGGLNNNMIGNYAAYYMYHRALGTSELAQNQAAFDGRYN